MSDSMSDSGSEESISLVQDGFLRLLGGAVDNFSGAFCCSGHVPITKESCFEKIKDEIADFQAVSPPVVIRWDRKDGSTIGKLTVPPEDWDAKSKDQQALKDLLNNCAPASFGKKGEDVIDESYRKAAKLDSDQFSTN